MQRSHIPGLAAAVITGGEVAWSNGYGWADIDRRVEMTPDALQNIGSISKTFVGTAVMQLKEMGALRLDDEVDRYLDFSVRNPNHPDSPITFLHLMTHRSSIADGPAYARGYVCGDSPISLEEWIRGYFAPDGEFFDATENFHAWAPDERFEYNNVAFGLLAYLVEVISETSFDEYCRNMLFEPLAMNDTSWHLRNIDLARHAVPYSFASNGDFRWPAWAGSEQGLASGEGVPPVSNGFAANCLYNHPNFPDGFLRTSVHQLARYQIAYLAGGSLGGERILSDVSIRDMLLSGRAAAGPSDSQAVQGLVWASHELSNGERVWGHPGEDPGIETLFDFHPSSGRGVIVFANTWGAELAEVGERLFEEAERL
jgi:CubicO group peptidase (beta-lactamase class C family)